MSSSLSLKGSAALWYHHGRAQDGRSGSSAARIVVAVRRGPADGAAGRGGHGVLLCRRWRRDFFELRIAEPLINPIYRHHDVLEHVVRRGRRERAGHPDYLTLIRERQRFPPPRQHATHAEDIAGL